MKGEFFFPVIKVYGPSRAEFLTGLAFSLFKEDTVIRIDCIFKGNCLWILYVYGLSFVECFVILIIYFFWTFLSAQAACNAFVCVNVSWVLGNCYFKVPFLPFCFFNL